MASRKKSVSTGKKTSSDLAYDLMIERAFFDHRKGNQQEFLFERNALSRAASASAVVRANGGKPVSNLGDVIYAYRSRRELPKRIRATQTAGLEWVIELAGRSKYRFKLAKAHRIVPRSDLISIPIPDATPEIIAVFPV